MEVEDVFRVYGYDPVRRVWTLCLTTPSKTAAKEQADILHKRKVRVRIIPDTRRVLKIKDPIVTPVREWRQEQAGKMLDLADAKKKYKSPG